MYKVLMSGKSKGGFGLPSGGSNNPHTPRSLVKKSLYIPLVTIAFMLLYSILSYSQPQQLDVSIIDISDKHIGQLLKDWENEKRAERREEKEKNMKAKKDGDERSTINKTTRFDRPFRYPRKNHRYQKLEAIRMRYNKETELLANISEGTPQYNQYNMQDSHTDTESFECVQLKVTPPTPICLYDSKQDVFVSKQIRELGIWEEHIVLQFQQVLSMDDTLGVIDIGANIGQYSLIAAKMGHPVLAVEPWGRSLSRFKKAADLAGIAHKIKVLKNSIYDKRTQICLKMTDDNQGNVFIESQLKPEYSRNSHCSHSNGIFLDDLLPFIKFKRAIVKIDIQGYEHRAFLHAKKLLNAIDVPYIFMEWVIMREFWVTPFHESLDKSIVRHLVESLTHMDYRVYSLVSKKELDIRYWHGWPEDVVWIHRTQIKENKNPIKR